VTHKLAGQDATLVRTAVCQSKTVPPTSNVKASIFKSMSSLPRRSAHEAYPVSAEKSRSDFVGHQPSSGGATMAYHSEYSLPGAGAVSSTDEEGE
jgi:hypothetical protein